MKKQSNQFTNTAAKAIFVIGVLIIVSSIIGGCVEGIKKRFEYCLDYMGSRICYRCFVYRFSGNYSAFGFNQK